MSKKFKHLYSKAKKAGWVIRRRGLTVDNCYMAGLWGGAKTVTPFPWMDDANDQIVEDGISSDWANVGGDLRAAIAAEKLRRERQVG